MKALKYAGIVAGSLLVRFLAGLIYRGLQVRDMPNLQKWHDPGLAEEFNKEDYQDFTNFEGYLNRERTLIQDSYDKVKPEDESGYNRYIPGNPVFARDANESFELVPVDSALKGGILLVHGLTDSPYHMKAVAEIFQRQGFYVLSLRLPGHGTIPGALVNVKWEDWYAAVEFGVRMVQLKLGKEDAFYVGGFSTGGALTLRYTLNSLDAHIPTPDKLFLFSPAIGITKKAELADWHKVISWIPFFKKFKWETIEPEYDPCKYNSFPKNAGDQIYELTKENKALVKQLNDKNFLGAMPPVYAFQSVADATVITKDLLKLLQQIGTNSGELVLFDINHSKDVIDFYKPGVEALEPSSSDLLEIKSRFTLVTNVVDSTATAYSWAAGSRENKYENAIVRKPVGTWPKYHYALAHISIPIPPGDLFYGQRSIFGTMNPRGENELLLISLESLSRLKYNPFFAYLENTLLEML